LPTSERHPLPNLSPQRKKERTLEALIRQLEGLARQQPTVMVFEDAHWIDPTSRELLDLTIERVGNLPVLLIVTFRPEFQPPWIGQPQVTLLALNRLDRRDRTVLVEQIAGGKALPDEVIDQIVERTDGVPLFVEELTKSVLESGLLRQEAGRYVLDRALPPLAIPTSLHASLLARLDRLASVRLVAQIGAAIGREFPYALLRAVSRIAEDELQAALGRLIASELVFQRGTPPDAIYAFKHSLVQDAAHGSLLRNARQQLHAQIAEALETRSPEVMDSQPELLAQHYAEAGLIEKSAAYWARPVIGPPPARRWRKRRGNCNEGWISWRCCRTAGNVSDRSSNFAVPWAPSCWSSKATRHRNRAMPMPARGSCGSSSVPPRSSFTFHLGSLAIMHTAANSIWRSVWTRICCV
jgi:predicted ATPase